MLVPWPRKKEGKRKNRQLGYRLSEFSELDYMVYADSNLYFDLEILE
jgi:hypothetical protein